MATTTKGRTRQRRADFIQIVLERRFARLDGLQELGNLAELGLHSGGNDQGFAASVGGGCSSVDHVFAVANRQIINGKRLVVFLNRNRYASQRGFLDLQIDGFEQTGIRGIRSPVCRRITSPGTRSRAGILTSFRRAERMRWRCHLLQGFDSAFGAIFLYKAQQDCEQHNHRNDD